jgi:hypothetical protein
MAITPAPLNTTSPSSTVSSQNPTTLNVIANPVIFSPDICSTILSSAIPPSTQQKLKEKVVKNLKCCSIFLNIFSLSIVSLKALEKIKKKWREGNSRRCICQRSESV